MAFHRRRLLMHARRSKVQRRIRWTVVRRNAGLKPSPTLLDTASARWTSPNPGPLALPIVTPTPMSRDVADELAEYTSTPGEDPQFRVTFIMPRAWEILLERSLLDIIAEGFWRYIEQRSHDRGVPTPLSNNSRISVHTASPTPNLSVRVVVPRSYGVPLDPVAMDTIARVFATYVRDMRQSAGSA